MSNIIYASEQALEDAINGFQKKFGILDEGEIVADNDYEMTLEFPLPEETEVQRNSHE